jgi:hypothetical protein
MNFRRSGPGPCLGYPEVVDCSADISEAEKKFRQHEYGNPMTLHLTFKPSGAANFELDIDSAATIADVKSKCAEQCGIEKESQKIIFKGMFVFVNWIYLIRRTNFEGRGDPRPTRSPDG